MPVNPAIWGATYKAQNELFYVLVGAGTKVPDQAPEVWQKFVTIASAGLAVIPPWGNQASPSEGAFSPLSFGQGDGPVGVAVGLATAWFNWYMGIDWGPPPPPIPPFSVINSVSSNPITTAAAMAVLTAALTAECAIIPPDPVSAQLKYEAIGAIFYTATIASGVILSGLDLEALPLELPFPAL